MSLTKVFCVIFLIAILATFVSANKLPGNTIEPGRYCDPVLYDMLIRPSTDALQKLYTEVETEKQIGAAVNFGEAARNMQRSLHSLIEIPPEHEDNKGAYRKKEGQNILATKACLGLVASFMTCDPEQSACVCKAEFPFSTVQENGECLGLAGSICAVDKQFVLNCVEGLNCEKEGIKAMRFCGGVPEYKKAQRVFLDKQSVAITLAMDIHTDSIQNKTVHPKSEPRLQPSFFQILTNQKPETLNTIGITTDNKTIRENGLKNLATKLEELAERLQNNSEKLAVALKKIGDLEATVQNITQKFVEDRTSVELHRHRIILLGIPEEKYETQDNLRARVDSLVSSEDLNVQGVMCGTLQRLGLPREDGRPRAVKINFCF